MDASPVVVIQHHHLGTSMPSGGVHTIKVALAYNLGNFMRTLAMPKTVERWSMTSLREKLIKIGAKVVSHGRYVTFHMWTAPSSQGVLQFL